MEGTAKGRDRDDDEVTVASLVDVQLPPVLPRERVDAAIRVLVATIAKRVQLRHVAAANDNS